jgi:plastocyanin
MPRAPLASASRATLAAAVAAAALAGCGDDTEGSSGSVDAKPGGQVQVEADEYSFKPGTVRMSGPGRVTFRLRNAGALPHDLTVRKGDDDVGATKAIGDGESAELTVTLASGDYEVYCSIGDHEELGMRGNVAVE